MATKTAGQKSSGRLKVGDRVKMIAGSLQFPALVVEDRGNIGVGGRQLIGIRRLRVPAYMVGPYEVAAEDVVLMSNGKGSSARKATSSRKRRFKVGDRVNILFGDDRRPAVVVEDRGNLGVGGRQVVGLRQLNVPDYMTNQFELSADDLELVRSASPRRSSRRPRSRGIK
jgi:hypothetical protein